MESAYWARFEGRGGQVLRFDTRIYLCAVDRPRRRDRPIGCIVGKNPGSALPLSPGGELQPIALQGDHFLPCVRSIVAKASARAGATPGRGAYVQVLNLFYVCNRDLRAAKQTLACLEPEPCPSEQRRFPWRWFAWGGPDPALDPLKRRFQTRRRGAPFFYDTPGGCIAARVPSRSEHARHTQGMAHDAVVEHLAALLRSPI